VIMGMAGLPGRDHDSSQAVIGLISGPLSYQFRNDLAAGCDQRFRNLPAMNDFHGGSSFMNFEIFLLLEIQ
jgi:hypothetical protein